MRCCLRAGTLLSSWQRLLTSGPRETGCSEQRVFPSRGPAMCAHQKLLDMINFSLLKKKMFLTGSSKLVCRGHPNGVSESPAG